MIQAALAAATFASAPPNLIWIMLDDMGWGEPGAYPCESKHGRIATPSMDAFAKEAMVFTDAYAGYTVCAPSRTTLMTGRHSGEFLKYNLRGTALDRTENVTTLGEVLQKAGYNTAIVGKTAPLNQPLDLGFDSFPIGQIDQAACHDMYPTTLDTQTEKGGDIVRVPLPLNDAAVKPSRDACMANPEKYNYTTDEFAQHGLGAIDAMAGKKDPFFLYLSFTVPHAGGWSGTQESGAPVPTDGQYANESWPDVEKDHAGTLHYVDNYVGQVIAKLKSLKVDDNTVVFIASDNGAHNEGGHDHTFFNSTGGLKGYKRSLYEGGVRSPSMVRWPGKIKPSRSNFQWAFWDALPTMAELAKADSSTLPANLEGESFVQQLLTGKQPPRKYIFHTWGHKGIGGYGVRQNDWKGVVQNCSGPNNTPSMDDKFELYDLTKDLFETTDVSAANPTVVKQMKSFVVSKNWSCHCYQC